MRKKWLPFCTSLLLASSLTTSSLAQHTSYSAQEVLEMKQRAENGQSLAQSALGVLYLEGQDIPQDYDKAHHWLQQAAQQNEKLAQFLLGLLYLQGEGVEQSDAQAQTWFGKACANGSAQGCDMYRKHKP